ncbi:MAG: N-carbamoylsarcosine amidohydrolase [Roseovarius sp.]|mgnify:FL=1|jgi:maleamate amidohydrolase
MDNRQENYRGVFDSRLGFGRRPVLVVIDFINAYTTPGSALYAPDVVSAVDASVELINSARDKQVPVIYTKVLFQAGGFDGGLFVQKIPALTKLVDGEPLAEIDAKITPVTGDIVIVKNYASVFFGTSLASMLTAHGIDTVILIGCSTSGCVRASAVDGMQHGFRVIVPRDCVGDRLAQVHDANLFDIDAKYGDVVGKSDVLDYLKTLETV